MIITCGRVSEPSDSVERLLTPSTYKLIKHVGYLHLSRLRTLPHLIPAQFSTCTGCCNEPSSFPVRFVPFILDSTYSRDGSIMCKFNNRLFTFVFLIVSCNAAPGFPFNRFIDVQDDYDYDIFYDQRQNGTENYRIKLDGFLIAFPPEADSDNNNYTNELVNLLGSELLGPFGNFDFTNEQSESEENRYAFYGKDQQEGNNGMQETTEQVINNKNEQILSKSAEINIPRNKPNKKRKTRFQIVNLLKMFRRNNEN